jgi:tRNA (mo5U34)-methyltransferase
MMDASSDLRSAGDLTSRIDGIRWFHRIDLRGITTKGWEDTPRKLRTLGFPSDLTGRTVLDIGAWDGFFSFECERRNAKRVLATDHFCWSGAGWGTKEGFDLARNILGSKVEDRDIDVFDLSSEAVGTFDLVLFLGVLYHVKHPLLALERVASVTRDQLILETAVDLTSVPEPAMRFYPGAELENDATNWWGPNPAAVEAMLKAVGFTRVQPLHDLASLGNRLAFHAWK